MGFDGSPDFDFPVDAGRYIGIDDQIMVQAVSNAATQAITVRGRLCLKSGKLLPFTFTFTTATAGTVLTKSFQLAEGFLESLQVSSPACATAGQWLYASIGLQRGTGAAAVPYECLFADYVGSVLSIGWPRAILRKPTEGPGTIRSILLSNPAAGTDFIITVPTGVRWKILGGEFIFTASAAVATRFVGLKITDGSHSLFGVVATATVLASGVETLVIGPGVPYYSDAFADTIIPFPDDTELAAGYTLGSVTVAMDVADQWSVITLWLKEWAELL